MGHMIGILKHETNNEKAMTVHDLFNVNDLKDQASKTKKVITEILQNKQNAVLTRVFVEVLLKFMAIVMFFSLLILGYVFYYVDVYNQLESVIDEFAMKYKTFWGIINEFVSRHNQNNQYAKLFFSSSIWFWIEDQLEEVMYEKNP